MRPIYAITSVLVAPSLWFEPWGRGASEAVFNNIPVIAANSGGLSEAIAGGGILLDTPEHCQQDYRSIPDDQEIRPWVETLKVFLTNNSDELLHQAKERLSQDNALYRLIAVLEPLMTKKVTTLDLNQLSDSALPDVHF